MKRKLLAAILTLALFVALGTVVYANHFTPPQGAVGTPVPVSLTKTNVFDFGEGNVLKGGHTAPGSADLYSWTITNTGPKRHIFAVEDASDIHLELTVDGTTVAGTGDDTVNFPAGSTKNVVFTLPPGSGKYKVYCEIHKGMLFYLNVP